MREVVDVWRAAIAAGSLAWPRLQPHAGAPQKLKYAGQWWTSLLKVRPMESRCCQTLFSQSVISWSSVVAELPPIMLITETRCTCRMACIWQKYCTHGQLSWFTLMLCYAMYIRRCEVIHSQACISSPTGDTDGGWKLRPGGAVLRQHHSRRCTRTRTPCAGVRVMPPRSRLSGT